MLGSRRSGDHKNAGANDLADADHDQACRPERAMQPVFGGDPRIRIGNTLRFGGRHGFIPRSA